MQRAAPAPVFDPDATHVTVRRFFANWIDYALIAFANGYVVGAVWSDAPWWLYWLTWPVPAMLYLGLLQGRTGWTLGKLVFALRVVDAEGRPPGLKAGIKRTLPLVVEVLAVVALVAILTSPTRQRFGDRWAHTYVVGRGALAAAPGRAVPSG